MKQRGRQSGTAAVTVLPDRAAAIQRVARPSPPHDLTDEETEIWVAVVNSQEADYFSPATHPLLADYCRLTIDARKISELIEKHMASSKATVEEYNQLLKMRQRTSSELSRLARTMRLAQQTTRMDSGNKTKPTSRRLWE